MPKSAPIIIIDDDLDDIEFLISALKDLNIPNELICFTNVDEVFGFLRKASSKPFLIFCDINMPRKNGLALKKELDADPVVRNKCIPFIFFSTSASMELVKQAFVELHVQGYFQKLFSHEETMHTVSIIIEYWKLCKHPNR